MRQIVIIFIIGVLFSAGAYSQISSSVNFVETEYADSNYIFVFCTSDANGGELVANDSTKKGGYEYQWYKFNSATNIFEPVSTGILNADSSQSVLANLSSGGYKVELTNGPKPQEYVAWVFINDELTLNLEFYEKNDCDIAGFLARPYYPYNNTFNTSFVYKDPNTLIEYTLSNKIDRFVWDSDNTETAVPSFNSASLYVTDLPWKNTTYTVIATDNFGCTISDDLYYEAIATKADFRWSSFDDKTLAEIENGTTESNLSGSAPLSVRFFNESKNAVKYRWFFGDSTRNDDDDIIETAELSLEPYHTYYYTNDTGKTYTMELYSESEYGCKDSVEFSLKVLPTKLEFPNVFTPNGDEKNDVFKLTDFQSIRNFKITIFNRAGQLVHEYDGDIRDWEGWKGYVKNTNNKAPEGNYFFVVNVKGWDRKTYDNDNIGQLSSGSTSTEETTAKSVEFGVVRLFRNQ